MKYYNNNSMQYLYSTLFFRTTQSTVTENKKQSQDNQGIYKGLSVNNEICQLSKLPLNKCMHSRSYQGKSRYKHYVSK